MAIIALLIALAWVLGLVVVVGLCHAARAGDRTVVVEDDEPRVSTSRTRAPWTRPVA